MARARADTPPKLGTRGRRLWTDLRKEGPFGPAERLLVEEACRIADRLDRLDSLISGEESTWFDLRETFEGSGIAEITINKPLTEARQQALALKQILTELRHVRGKDGAGDPGGDEVDELAVARAKRVAAATRR